MKNVLLALTLSSVVGMQAMTSNPCAVPYGKTVMMCSYAGMLIQSGKNFLNFNYYVNPGSSDAKGVTVGKKGEGKNSSWWQVLTAGKTPRDKHTLNFGDQVVIMADMGAGVTSYLTADVIKRFVRITEHTSKPGEFELITLVDPYNATNTSPIQPWQPVAFKVGDKYLTVESGDNHIAADRTSIGDWERWYFVYNQ